MKLTLKNTPEQVELVRAMGSKNMTTSREAQEAFAAFLGPVIQRVISQAGTAGNIFTDAPFDEDDSPSYPLDLYYNESKNFITVWSQNMAGGMPNSHVEGMQELKISTYRLDSAISFLKRYARKARLDVISKAIERMAQEVLVKQERNAWAVILKALAEASTKTDSGDTLKHAYSTASGAGSAKQFEVNDLNNLMTRIKRLNESFAGGTPADAYSKGITDMYVSPEKMADVRSFAYQALGGSSSGKSSTDLPDGVREEIWRNAGMHEIYGVNIHELIELGVGKKYNTLFDTMAGSTTYGGDISAEVFAATDELVVGLDNSKGAFIRPIARQAENGVTFGAVPDDQFNISRIDKAGFYGSLEEGRICIDSRAIVGLIFKD